MSARNGRPENLAETVEYVDGVLDRYKALPDWSRVPARRVVAILTAIRGGMVAPVEWAEVNVAELIEERDTALAERDRARTTAARFEQEIAEVRS